MKRLAEAHRELELELERVTPYRKEETMDKRAHARKAPKHMGENNVTYQTIREQLVITGQGSLVDLSEGGCRISGHTRLRKGVQIQLALHSEGGEVSTILSACEVMWVQETEFGVKFLWDFVRSSQKEDHCLAA